MTNIVVFALAILSAASFLSTVSLLYAFSSTESTEIDPLKDFGQSEVARQLDVLVSSPQVHPWMMREYMRNTQHPVSSDCSMEKLWIRNRTKVPDSCYPLSDEQVCNAAPPGLGPEGEGGYQVLQNMKPSARGKATKKLNPRILCLIYTNSEGHDRVRTSAHTWGQRCDGFLALSNLTDPSIGALELPHRGREVYGNMWQKTRAILKHVHDHYIDDFDFFHLCGDDVYLIVENMKEYLESDEFLKLGQVNATEPQSYSDLAPLFLGAPYYLDNPIEYYMCVGGPGYTLNAAALRLFNDRIYSECMRDQVVSEEDRMISLCLWELGVRCQGGYELAGAAQGKRGAKRYHFLDAEAQVQNVQPFNPKLKHRFAIPFKRSFLGVSNMSFAFHMKQWSASEPTAPMLKMQRYEVFLHDKC